MRTTSSDPQLVQLLAEPEITNRLSTRPTLPIHSHNRKRMEKTLLQNSFFEHLIIWRDGISKRRGKCIHIRWEDREEKKKRGKFSFFSLSNLKIYLYESRLFFSSRNLYLFPLKYLLLFSLYFLSFEVFFLFLTFHHHSVYLKSYSYSYRIEYKKQSLRNKLNKNQ